MYWYPLGTYSLLLYNFWPRRLEAIQTRACDVQTAMMLTRPSVVACCGGHICTDSGTESLRH